MLLWPLEPPPTVHRTLDEWPTDLSEVHLYVADLDEERRSGRWNASVLSAAERVHADRLRDPVGRERYVVGRAIVRHVLGRTVEVAPADLRIVPNTFGKPFLSEEWVALPSFAHFNVSHRDQVFLLGVTGRGDVGVDVELLKPISDVEQVATDHLPPARARAICASAPEDRLLEFYRAWTLEEAIAKASGGGLSAMRTARIEDATAPDSFALVWQTELSVNGLQAIASVALGTLSAGAVT